MTLKISKSELPEQRMVWGEVYAPDRPDADGEFMRADEIRKMAYDFMRNQRTTQIDHMHDNMVNVSRNICVIESFIARKGDPDFIEGSWVVGMHVPDDEMWGKIKKGEVNGFSMEALVIRKEQDCDLEIPPVISGLTSKAEGHEHKFYVHYDDNGAFKGGRTDVVDGHLHEIVAGTHTQLSRSHQHRFSSVDTLKIE